MASKFYEFTGPIKYARVWLGQLDMKFAQNNPRGGNWSVVMNLQGDELMRYNALGCKAKAARLDDPEKKIEKGDLKFRRFEKSGINENMGPPKVTGVEEGTSIGNGSNATVVVEVYDYPQPDGTRGFTSRLAEVKINDLIEYVKPVANDGPPI